MAKTTHVATLKTGGDYTVQKQTFLKGAPKQVEKELADYLKKLKVFEVVTEAEFKKATATKETEDDTEDETSKETETE